MRLKGSEDALPVGAGRRDGRYRRHEIGHYDRARKLPRGVRQHCRQHLAIAEMDMPIIRPAQCDGLWIFRHWPAPGLVCRF